MTGIGAVLGSGSTLGVFFLRVLLAGSGARSISLASTILVLRSIRSGFVVVGSAGLLRRSCHALLVGITGSWFISFLLGSCV